jgi:hypothetical protein
MIGWFTLYRCSDDEGEGKGGYGNFFYKSIHLRIGLKGHGDYFKLYLVEFQGQDITPWGMP